MKSVQFLHAHRLARTICARAHLRAQKFRDMLPHALKMCQNVIFGVAWWNERARANARAPKKLSDSKWLMFVNHFYFLNHACNSKSRRYNAGWRSIQNENSAFSPFNRQGWLDRKMRFQKVSIYWYFHFGSNFNIHYIVGFLSYNDDSKKNKIINEH